MNCNTPGFPLLPRVCSNSCPLSQWCHPTISSSVTAFSSWPQSFPAPGSFPVSWLFASCSQSTGVSASALVLPVNIQSWFPSYSLISNIWLGIQNIHNKSFPSKWLEAVWEITVLFTHCLKGHLSIDGVTRIYVHPWSRLKWSWTTRNGCVITPGNKVKVHDETGEENVKMVMLDYRSYWREDLPWEMIDHICHYWLIQYVTIFIASSK